MTQYSPTKSEIEAAKTEKGGYTKSQLAAWGVPWPPEQGWKKRLIAKQERPKTRAGKAWDRREQTLEPVTRLGFSPYVLSAKSRHMRIQFSSRVYFDFWPSSEKWLRSRDHPKGRFTVGHGVDSLVAALKNEPSDKW